MNPEQGHERYALYVGLDMAARSVTGACLRAGQGVDAAFEFAQSAEGYASLRQRLAKLGVEPKHTLLVMEATGSYWIPLALDLHQAGYAVSVINPLQAHHFAKALLKRAKTDALDAQTLAQLAAKLTPPPWTPPPPIYHALQQRLAERDTLLQMQQQLKNQLHALQAGGQGVEGVLQRKQALIEAMAEQVTQIERELQQHIEADSEWQANFRRLQSITGVGVLTAAWLMVSTLNFTTAATPEALASFAGLAPIVRRSGASLNAQPHIGHYGDARLRTALYMAALSAARFNPLIRPFYERLRKAGKPPKVARCAAARKLLTLAFTLVRKGQDFDPNHPSIHPSTPP